MSRESEHTPEERREILAQVLLGMANGRTVADTAREVKVRAGTIRQWIARDPAVYEEYRRMRPLLGAAFAEEAIRVARESSNATSAQDRTLIDTLKWAAAKAAPIEYGEKQVVEHQGQQTLQVKVLEEDAPVRNVQALKESVVAASLNTAATTLSLPAIQRIEYGEPAEVTSNED
jgi:transposase-like protein